MVKKRLLLGTALVTILSCGLAYGQSNPGFTQGSVLNANTPSGSTQPGLNNAFTTKQDYPISGTTLNTVVTGLPSSGTLTGSEQLFVATNGSAFVTTTGAISAGTIINGSVTPNNLIVGGTGTNQVQDSSQCSNGMCKNPSGVAYTGNLSYAGTATPAWFKVDGLTVSGVSSSAAGCCLGLNMFRLYLGSDTVNASTPGTLSEMVVVDAPSANFTGFRTAITGYIEVVGSPASGSPNMVGVLGQVRSQSNLGGTSGTYTNGSGSVFAMNANAFLQSGATELLNITGIELDTSVPTGASVKEKHSLTVIKSASDAVQGEFDDSAIEFDDQDGTSVGWNYGISFGAFAHKWSFSSTSTLIGIQNRVAPSPASSPANIGVDMTNGSFTTAQYKGTGFLVDPTGKLSATNLTLTSTGSVTPGSSGAVCANGSGVIGFNTANCIASMRALKIDDGRIDDGLQVVMQLDPRYYRYTDEFLGSARNDPDARREQPGFMAEDVASIDPRYALWNNGHPSGVRYEQLTAALTAAIQEQQREIEELKSQLRGR